MIEPWTINGELILNCSCTVFCPCVVSLGKHPPTEGYCQGWAGIRIDDGKAGDVDLSGINVAVLLDIPGNMGRGNWTAALYVDESASDAAFDKLVEIFSGKARGTTGLFSILVSSFLGAERQPISYITEGKTRRLEVGKRIKGAITPVGGKDPDQEIVINNTEYWMGPDITVAQADESRVRAYGRVWDFNGRSAEICQIAWAGP